MCVALSLIFFILSFLLSLSCHLAVLLHLSKTSGPLRITTTVNRWGPLMGPGKAFDPKRFLVLCANVAGSPYGTISPVSIDPDTGEPYGPSFPPTSIRDDILWVPSHHPVDICAIGTDVARVIPSKVFTSTYWTTLVWPPSQS